LEEVEHDTQDILDLIQNLPNAPISSVVHEEEEVFEDILHDLDALSLNQAEQDLSPSIEATQASQTVEEDKSLMVMMSFTDWLNHFKHKQIKDQEEEKDQKALKTAWKKEKLAAAVEEEQDDIPDNIFKQAMDSISLESSIISESLAEILAKQGKRDKAIDMYKKLSLRNPEKSSYFASLIKDLNLNNF
jgi:tetratricopeptide (TPR) repeat protein